MSTLSGSMKAARARKNAVRSRREIEDLIARGKTIIIIDNMILNADAWLPFHPGGDKAIRHMVGRDATDEVKALHSAEALQHMKSFQVGTIDKPWHNFTPPIQGGHFRTTSENEVCFNELNPEEPQSSSESGLSTSSESDSQEGHASLRRRNLGSSTPMSSLSSNSSSEEVLNTPSLYMARFTQEGIEEDNLKYPATDRITQHQIVQKYRELYQTLLDGGYFNCNYWAYGKEICRYSLLFGGFLYFLSVGWFSISGLCLGLLWHQLVFTVHDAGHMGITHNFTIDTLIGMTIASHIGGLSLGWWKRNHNVHHIVTNSPEHDPDIEHMPFFMISHRFFSSLKSSYYERVMEYDTFANFMAVYQKYLYYPVLLFGRFNLYRLSWVHLILGQGPKKGVAWWHRWYEIIGQVVFWYWYGYLVVYKSIPTTCGRVVFVLVSHMVTAPLHVQITLSHFAMSTSDLGVDESFPQKMLRTTMDVDCPEWLDFIHGGLQFQAIHHLYPRMPRHNLRRAQSLVQEFCEDVGIPYALYGFMDGNKQVIGRFAEVGRQAKILSHCQEHIKHQMIRSGGLNLP